QRVTDQALGHGVRLGPRAEARGTTRAPGSRQSPRHKTRPAPAIAPRWGGPIHPAETLPTAHRARRPAARRAPRDSRRLRHAARVESQTRSEAAAATTVTR